MELASNLLVPGTVYGLNSEACPHGRKLSVLFKGNFISLTKHMEIFKETGKFFCTNLTLPKYKEKLCFPLRFVRWSSYFEISCDKNVNEDSSSYVPNTAAYHSKTLNKMGNLDLYLHAIIFDRFITFSYQIRSPPATLRLAWTNRFCLGLNPTDQELSRAETVYSVLENHGEEVSSDQGSVSDALTFLSFFKPVTLRQPLSVGDINIVFEFRMFFTQSKCLRYIKISFSEYCTV